MPTTITERHLEFTFGDAWNVLRYDNEDERADGKKTGHPFYRDQVSRLEGAKAVDFVGTHGGDTAYLVEVKDFRGYRIRNKRRITTNELATEIAQKVRDTLAGLVAAKRNHPAPGVLGSVAAMLMNPKRTIRIVLWLEDDLSHRNLMQWKAEQAVLTDKIKTRIGWFSSRVLVVDQGSCQQQPPDVQVRNLPGAGQGV
jgi:hypothetical protein